MAFPAPLTLNDGSGTSPTGDHVYATSGYGAGSHSYSEGAAALDAPASVSIAHTQTKKGGSTTRRSKFEVSQVVEDGVSGAAGNVRAYLILEVPMDIADKTDATKVVKQLIHAFTMSSGANIAELVNGSL